MASVNFKASFITNVDVQKKQNKNNYKDVATSLVELDPKDKNDVMALAKTAYEWEKVSSNFAPDIYNEALKTKSFPDVEAEHFYAVTNKKSNFKKLNTDKILGLALFSEKMNKPNELNWLQVSPKQNFGNKTDRKYRQIGTSIVKFLQDEYPEKPIYIQSANSAVGFYKKNQFKPISYDEPTKMIWNV